MNWLKPDEVSEFLNQFNYDVRISGNARWIDQKCTPDVLAMVADCIAVFSDKDSNAQFTTKDIWHSDYAVENVEAIFKKPGLESKAAKNEYDKFFQQPMELLSYAKILKKTKIGTRNFYSVSNPKLLSFIAMRERNALVFLQLYTTKVLKDSGLTDVFDQFILEQTKNSFDALKIAFEEFTILNTKIKNRVECRRIFTKVLNPLAYMNNVKGTELGRLSRNKVTYDMLMYNRDNFRDIWSLKPKDQTRKEHLTTFEAKPSLGYFAYASQKAKRVVRNFNDKYRNGLSEVVEPNHLFDKAIHVHHIFPESGFPEICDYYENLIALTPTQHLSYAHPNGHTNKINPSYQSVCLLAKVDSIEETYMDKSRDQIYEFHRFLHVLSVGFKDPTFLQIADWDFASLVASIEAAYSGK